MNGNTAPSEEITVLRGRDHTRVGAQAVARLGPALAVAMSAGARTKALPAVDPNEDVGAVVKGGRAHLLVVADGHFGREASEAAVDHVLEELGDDPPPADLADEELVDIFHAAALRVERETSSAWCAHPDSATTLALALVAAGAVQWAALGDSCVVLATPAGGARLDVPRRAYLGHQLALGDIAAALTRGRIEWSGVACVVLATDGLIDVLDKGDQDLPAIVGREIGRAPDAGLIAQTLLRLALEGEADDAVTIAVASRPALGRGVGARDEIRPFR